MVCRLSPVALAAVVQHRAVEVVSVDGLDQNRHKLRVRQAKQSGPLLKAFAAKAAKAFCRFAIEAGVQSGRPAIWLVRM